MKVLLFGKNGQVGWELNRLLLPLGEIIALDREQADFSNLESLRKIVRDTKPDVIVNAVAYTSVDKAEEEEELANTINAIAPGILAEEAKKQNALLIHYSTDYVFDGVKNSPYVETDKPNPINAYGRTKLAGEQELQKSGCDYLILRTSWVYATRGINFLLTILNLAKERSVISVVSDQIGSPVPARLIAATTLSCISQSMKDRKDNVYTSGLYHLTTSGVTSWHGFAVEIVKDRPDLKLKCEDIKAISSAEYTTPARRPLNSRLSMDKLQNDFSVVMPDWKSALELCVKEVNCII